MKILRAIIFALVLGLTMGAVIAATVVNYAEHRRNRDNHVFMQGRVSGFNECQKDKQRTGVLVPNMGVTKGESLEDPSPGYRDST